MYEEPITAMETEFAGTPYPGPMENLFRTLAIEFPFHESPGEVKGRESQLRSLIKTFGTVHATYWDSRRLDPSDSVPESFYDLASRASAELYHRRGVSLLTYVLKYDSPTPLPTHRECDSAITKGVTPAQRPVLNCWVYLMSAVHDFMICVAKKDPSLQSWPDYDVKDGANTAYGEKRSTLTHILKDHVKYTGDRLETLRALRSCQGYLQMAIHDIRTDRFPQATTNSSVIIPLVLSRILSRIQADRTSSDSTVMKLMVQISNRDAAAIWKTLDSSPEGEWLAKVASKKAKDVFERDYTRDGLLSPPRCESLRIDPESLSHLDDFTIKLEELADRSDQLTLETAIRLRDEFKATGPYSQSEQRVIDGIARGHSKEANSRHCRMSLGMVRKLECDFAEFLRRKM